MTELTWLLIAFVVALGLLAAYSVVRLRRHETDAAAPGERPAVEDR